MLDAWNLDHAVLWVLPALAVVYECGWRRLHAQMPARYPVGRMVAFIGGLTIVFVAVASPLDAYGAVLLQVHMTQHMLLMMVAPPLLWLGQPILPFLRACPPRLTRRVLRPLLVSQALRRVARVVTHPAVCWSTFALAFVVWHVPRYYELGLRSEPWHQLQHACFFSAALLFWWPVVHVWPSAPVWPRWTMIPYLVAADLLNTALSAMLTFSSHVLYPSYEHAPRLAGVLPLDDQALAGVIMWVPGSIAYLIPAMLLTIELLQRPQRPAWTTATSLVRQ